MDMGMGTAWSGIKTATNAVSNGINSMTGRTDNDTSKVSGKEALGIAIATVGVGMLFACPPAGAVLGILALIGGVGVHSSGGKEQTKGDEGATTQKTDTTPQRPVSSTPDKPAEIPANPNIIPKPNPTPPAAQPEKEAAPAPITEEITTPVSDDDEEVSTENTEVDPEGKVDKEAEVVY
jgi:hypothetical protein